MPHTSTALSFRNINALQPCYMEVAWVVLPSFSTPVPELGKIFAPQGNLPKGSGSPPGLGRRLWNWFSVAALNSTSQSRGEMEQALLKSINSRKRP